MFVTDAYRTASPPPLTVAAQKAREEASALRASADKMLRQATALTPREFAALGALVIAVSQRFRETADVLDELAVTCAAESER